MKAAIWALLAFGCGVPVVDLDATILEPDASAMDGGEPARDAAAMDAQALQDAGSPTDAWVPSDAGSPVDASVPMDAGPSDGGPVFEECSFPGLWRNSNFWCEGLPNVVRDYDCALILTFGSGWMEWSGEPNNITWASFVIEAQVSGTTWRTYACRNPPPTTAYRLTCEEALETPCDVAAREPDEQHGTDWVPLCDAAAARGLALLYSFDAFPPCRPPVGS
jgi:hypothetical protein